MWLVRDDVAGVAPTTLLVPQGMADAELAGLRPITGLYTTLMCLLGYALFDPSRLPVLGPGLLTRPDDRGDDRAAARARRDPQRAVTLASMLALMVAVVVIVAGWVGLGFIADLLPGPR